MALLFTVLTVLAYLASFGFLLACIKKQQRATPLFALSFGAALCFHAIANWHSVFLDQQLNLSIINASSVVFFAIGVIALSNILRHQALENLVLVVIPFTALSAFLSYNFGTINSKLIEGSGLISHIILSILAYSFITIAALQASLLGIMEGQLRKHQFNGIFRYLPPLQTMETLLFEMIWLGFVTLSIAIITGFSFLSDMFAQHLAHKTILSILAWAVFAVLLFGRHRYGWRGLIAIRYTLAGFFILMLAYFGTKLVLEVILQ